ncbi:visual pigment-like receptor peropsin [Brachionus plicatilis]|uniref:Visual pigment-like receptor peropsin n=1 Tax=Brachionus plicatilis TaxID=10195 RepID=A0A3M7QSR6_BRAPC|nr:visual pigment-like receptor peropsin [Brachionus plicatilis]
MFLSKFLFKNLIMGKRKEFTSLFKHINIGNNISFADEYLTKIYTQIIEMKKIYPINSSINHSSLIEPLVENCSSLKIISLYCTILFSLSMIFNLVLLRLFYLYKELRKSFNLIILALVLLNLFGTLFELPILIVTNYYCEWVFPTIFCPISAFIMYFVGCTSIYLMVAISFERLYVIGQPMTRGGKQIAKSFYSVVIFACVALGLWWSVLPFFGWSYYSFEGVGTSCSVEWNEKSLNVMSYNLTILIKKFRKSKQELFTNNKTRSRISVEKNLIIVTSLLITFFILSWLPYGLVSIHAAISSKVKPLIATLPALFAKSSLFWTSFLYMMVNNQAKRKLAQIFNRAKNSTQVPPTKLTKLTTSKTRLKRTNMLSVV